MPVSPKAHYDCGMNKSSLLAVALLFGVSMPAAAATYAYDATCGDSVSKQGDQNADLTKDPGSPIRCTGITLSQLDNGRILIQILEKTSHLTPLGFSGSSWDYEINPSFVTLPIERIALPHATNPGVAQMVSGVEGFCFLDGSLNIKKLSSVACTAKIEIGPQKLIYRVAAHINGVGRLVPGL